MVPTISRDMPCQSFWLPGKGWRLDGMKPTERARSMAKVCMSGTQPDGERDSTEQQAVAKRAKQILTCKGFEECLQHSGSQACNYGRMVRVPLDFDRRVFTPTQRTTRGMANTRLKAVLSMAIMQAAAIDSIRNRQLERMRSLVSPGLPLAA